MIYIVDSDPTFRETLREEVSGAGYGTSVYETGADGFGAIEGTVPDMVVLGLDLADQSGLDILATIRSDADERVAKVPVIVISTTGALGEISEAIKLHISDYIVRQTYRSGDLPAKVRKHLANTGGISASPAVAQSAGGAAPALPGHEMSILIVEDDKFLRDLAVQKLEKEGIKTFAAMDGEQGIAIATKEIPDVILLDILLPGIDGFEVLTRVKQDPALVRTTVIMLSNFGQREDIDRAKKLGAEQFLIKASYTLDEIIQEVKKVISKKQNPV